MGDITLNRASDGTVGGVGQGSVPRIRAWHNIETSGIRPGTSRQWKA